jgi:hypothetical protein
MDLVVAVGVLGVVGVFPPMNLTECWCSLSVGVLLLFHLAVIIMYSLNRETLVHISYQYPWAQPAQLFKFWALAGMEMSASAVYTPPVPPVIQQAAAVVGMLDLNIPHQ